MALLVRRCGFILFLQEHLDSPWFSHFTCILYKRRFLYLSVF